MRFFYARKRTFSSLSLIWLLGALLLAGMAKEGEAYCKSDLVGYFHTCPLLNTSTIKCFGSSQYGQLGYGHTSNRGDGAGEMGDYLAVLDLYGDVKSVSLSQEDSCAVFTDFSATC